jgi:hypothetical protein
LRDRLNTVREQRGAGDRAEEDGKKLKCFRCQEQGHHQKDCTNGPICYKWKEEGHMAAECAQFHSKASELKMFGFAIPDQGFYSITIPGEVGSQKAAIIQILQSDASEKKVEDELQNLINNKWNWQVKQVDVKEFTAVFPDKQ